MPTTTAPATTAAPAPTKPAAVRYANCAAVRAAGKAPLRRGAPGYRAGLDTDGDGVACETESTTAKPKPTPPKPSPKPKPDNDPRFATCKAAKAAGYGPYHLGRDPEYHWYRDADSDGKVCE